ncbi:MAG: hypothetical protein HZA15_12045 [Nitrospirae bacterium]|nr:hypothetical protein [Nitrospirota bacterium]
MTNFLKLFFVSIIILTSACAPKKVETPAIEQRSVDVALTERRSIERIDATLSVVFEKTDSEMHGDAVLDIAQDGDLHMKVYTLGILAMDLTSKNGLVKSTPKLDKNKTAILTKGLRDCLFWWDLTDFTIREENDHLILQNATRQVVLDGRTMLPQKQRIFFDDGKQLTISYDNPAQAKGVWYQSKMRIELSRYAVTLTVREITFTERT